MKTPTNNEERTITDCQEYQIKFSKKQLQIYIEAVECFSRFLGGQVDDICKAVSERKKMFPLRENDPKDPSFLLKRALFPELSPNEAYGIGYGNKKCEWPVLEDDHQISYEMYREALHFLVNKKDSMNVYSSRTLAYSNQPLPVVEKLSSDEKESEL